ncbi:MAG: hypothetical protein JSW51_06090 [Gemmatimonadota bacterium]|nr:MAG: hypothetical protein JSW51_06090 [Gemmatimonadota bacterium]
MSQGHEYVQRVQKALSEYEDAIVHREHKKLLESKVSVQQDADNARQKVVDTVVDIVTKVRMEQ